MELQHRIQARMSDKGVETSIGVKDKTDGRHSNQEHILFLLFVAK